VNGIRWTAAAASLAVGATLLALAGVSGANHATTQLVSTGQGGGNGAVTASFVGASADGSRVFFVTNEPLEAGDTDSSTDIYERAGGATTRISTGSGGGNGAFTASFVGASADGSRVFFHTSESLEAGDDDSAQDVYERSGSATSRISTGPAGGNGAFAASFVGASADGTRVFFITNEQLEAGDTDSSQDVYERAGSTTTRISTGPAGGNGAFTATFRDASADGTRVFFITNEQLEAGDTDSSTDVYERAGGATTRISTGPAGGNGAFTADFRGASADGTRVFFVTNEQLEAGDTDSSQDVYERAGGATTWISTGPGGGNGAFTAVFRGASADGTRVFFTTAESLEAGDTDSATDVYERAGSTTTRISTGPGGGNGAFTAVFRGASADGTRVFFTTDESLEAGDTDSAIDIYERAGSTTTRISTGPGGGNGAVAPFFFGASADGTRVFFTTTESLEAGDTDSATDIYERAGATTTRISTGPGGGNGAFSAVFGGASADGTRVLFTTSESLTSLDADSSQDVYAAGIAVTSGYPRPVGATPFRVSLVPLYEQCADPNIGHAAPFSFEGCNPPVLASDHLTVGTPDANGAGANSLGSLRIAAVVGVPGGVDDADARIQVSLTDVRNQGSLSDYTGELRATADLRLTDKAHGASATLPGTTVDFPLNVDVPCSATGATGVGGSCSLTTTLDTLVPGAVKEGKRTIYDVVGGVDVFDGGPDGDTATTSGNTLFATDGFFVP